MEDSKVDYKDKIIVALDVSSRTHALMIVNRLAGLVSFYKVGYNLFISEGMSFVKELIARGNRVFLDLKMYDVPDTIEGAVRQLAWYNIEFLTVSGHAGMVAAACNGRGEKPFPRILYVPSLSSDAPSFNLFKTNQALEAGADGVVTSGVDRINHFRVRYPKLPIVSPGIRMPGESNDGHVYRSTPGEAIKAGANYIVVGRNVARNLHPVEAFDRVVNDILTEVKGGR